MVITKLTDVPVSRFCQIASGMSAANVIVTVRDGARGEFDAGWRDWLASYADVLLARPLPGMPGSFYATTVDCLRLDQWLIIEPLLATLPGIGGPCTD